eukprot:CAMPEP_0172509386 /NCGR_PEP_ID=MMETSP1066-20121228/219912_1 /TAXON_ID=671091 /ORGANISM="Coscinodiscus wailesii, Strain CCMP2513" /LENGTH=680 /DNA_ID=CAMNT_0013287841 /DNA_START=146 /DNA_END=2188 /DNA_ORIENTATION=-
MPRRRSSSLPFVLMTHAELEGGFIGKRSDDTSQSERSPVPDTLPPHTLSSSAVQKRSARSASVVGSMKKGMRRASLVKFVSKTFSKKKNINDTQSISSVPYGAEKLSVNNSSRKSVCSEDDNNTIISETSKVTLCTLPSTCLGAPPPSYSNDNDAFLQTVSKSYNNVNSKSCMESLPSLEESMDSSGDLPNEKTRSRRASSNLGSFDGDTNPVEPDSPTRRRSSLKTAKKIDEYDVKNDPDPASAFTIKTPASTTDDSVSHHTDEMDTSAHSVYSHDSIPRFMHKKTSIVDTKTTPEAAAKYQYINKKTKEHETVKVFVILLHFQSRKFELIQIDFLKKKGTIGGILDSIPIHAVELILGFQKYRGLCRPTDGVEMVDRDSLAASRNGWRIRKGEVLVAIPDGFSGTECLTVFNRKLSRHPKLAMLLGRGDPLRKVRKPKSQRRKNKSSDSIIIDEIVFQDMVEESVDDTKSQKSGNVTASDNKVTVAESFPEVPVPTPDKQKTFDSEIEQPPVLQAVATHSNTALKSQNKNDPQSAHDETRLVPYDRQASFTPDAMENALQAAPQNTSFVARYDTTDVTEDDGSWRRTQTMVVVPRNIPRNQNSINLDEFSVKIISGVVAMMSPMGAQGLVVGATIYAIANYLQKNGNDIFNMASSGEERRRREDREFREVYDYEVPDM